MTITTGFCRGKTAICSLQGALVDMFIWQLFGSIVLVFGGGCKLRLWQTQTMGAEVQQQQHSKQHNSQMYR